MKTSFLLNVILTCVALSAFAPLAVAQAEPKEKAPLPIRVPAEVRAQMSAGARSLSLLPLPPKAGTPPLLLHAWVIDKPSNPAPSASENGKEELPFHLDFFFQRDSKWRLGTSVSYMGERPVTPLEYSGAVTYEAHWLRPSLKEGIVIAEETWMSSYSTVRGITLPQGVPCKTRPMGATVQVQEFYKGNFGGHSASTITFGVDAKGWTTLVCNAGGYTITTYGWRNGSWKEVKKQTQY